MQARHVLASTAIALATALALLMVTHRVRAENWPMWRGPRGDGTSLEIELADHWDGRTGENIVWKTAIPGQGHGSPMVWNDRVFLATCRIETEERLLVCLDRRDGSTLWQRTVLTAPLETKHARNSYASCTPATDGHHVFVAFLETSGQTVPATNVSAPRLVNTGTVVVAAYDFAGRPVWTARPGGFVSVHGFCSNPVLFENLVIINGDHDGDSYLVALDKDTGRTVWKVPRDHKTRSYVTPIVRHANGRTQLVLSGSLSVTSYDPRTGSKLWQIDGPTEQFVASPVFDGRHFYIAAGFPTYHVMAIRPDGSGNVTRTHVTWHVTNARCYVPSPVLVNGNLLVADDRGTANCFDTRTGERRWQIRLGRQFSASLVTAKGLVYFLAEDGAMHIVRPSAQPEIVAENALGEACFASPAIADGHILIRGEEHLYCIGASAKTENHGQ